MRRRIRRTPRLNAAAAVDMDCEDDDSAEEEATGLTRAAAEAGPRPLVLTRCTKHGNLVSAPSVHLMTWPCQHLIASVGRQRRPRVVKIDVERDLRVGLGCGAVRISQAVTPEIHSCHRVVKERRQRRRWSVKPSAAPLEPPHFVRRPARAPPKNFRRQAFRILAQPGPRFALIRTFRSHYL
jgi:hypothetical protein